MRKSRIILSLICIFTLSISFAGSGKKSKSVSVMTYNLENLFDNEHDKGKNDYTYLPLKVKNSSTEVQDYCATVSNEWYRRSCFELDWNNEIINKKIQNMARVIKSYDKGRGADIIVFEEVENKNILTQLVKKGLSKKGYRYISLIEGPDTRGIDVGVISRFPIVSQKSHIINLAPVSTRTTRNILEVTVKAYKRKITVFANHWPSQGNVDDTRVLASEVLRKAALKSRSDIVIAMGDFNTLHDDAPHGLNMNIYPIFEDVEEKGRLATEVKAPGTHWYRGVWESLDKIFVLKKSLTKNIKIDYKSFEIIYEDFMLKNIEWTDRETGAIYFDSDIPNRFDSKTGYGYSDHLPVAVKIRL